jgi:hypothetical protein
MIYDLRFAICEWRDARAVLSAATVIEGISGPPFVMIPFAIFPVLRHAKNPSATSPFVNRKS